MSEFTAFLQLGFNHIVDIAAYDHLLFIITLCAFYQPADWKKLLVLITAFTIGHSLTLVLSGFNILRVPANFVEQLIPVTILLTSLHNVWAKKAEGAVFSKAVSGNYFLALFFGLIHGMGFANYFRTLMGETGNVAAMLFPFNMGIELGQIVIVLVFFGAFAVLIRIFTIPAREWTVFVSGAGAGGALMMLLSK